MNSSTSARSSAAKLELTSATTTNVFTERSSWGDSPLTGLREYLATSTSITGSTWGPGSYVKFWTAENKFDEAEREALIATVIDSIIAASHENPFSGLRAVLDGLSKPLESEPSGFVYVPEGTGVTSTVWPGGSTYSPSTTTNWYSSTREGTFTTLNWEY
jgi:hypothetical protein